MQYVQNRTFQNNERKFYQQAGKMTRTYTNNRMQEKLNNSGVKYDNQGNIKKNEWIINMAKALGLVQGPKAEIHIDLLRMTQKYIKLENARP